MDSGLVVSSDRALRVRLFKLCVGTSILFLCALGQVVWVDELDNIENTVPVLIQTVVQYCKNAILAVASSPS